MSKFVILHGFGGSCSGGGADLNFEIVGGMTQPTNPVENMIWINTNTPITGYYFSITKPENVNEGEVWIKTGMSSNVSFDIVDRITSYPIGVQQYIKGIWINKICFSYQNGKWIEWLNGRLFDNGNQFEDITGGWYKNSNLYYDSTHQNIGTVNIANTIYLSNGSTASSSAIATTKNKIDLTDYDTLNFEVQENSTDAAWIYIHNITSGSLETNYVATTGKAFPDSNHLISLDISGITGEFYISVATQGLRTVEFVKIYCSKLSNDIVDEMAEYQLVEYIQSSGTQYVLTGITGHTGLRIEADAQGMFTSGNACLIGSHNGTHRCLINYQVDNKQWEFGASDYKYGSKASSADKNRHNFSAIIQQGTSTLSIDGSVHISISNVPSFDNGVEMAIFARHREDGTVERVGAYKVYSLQIIDNGITVRDFIPVIRIADNKAGFYDAINKVFYTNSGTGALIAGPTI